MKRVITLFSVLLHSSHVCVLGSVVRKYTYNYLWPKTWQEARECCRSVSGDLALLTQQSDIDLLNPNIYLSWIGLYKNGSQWKWSDGANDSDSTFDEKDKWGDCAVANSSERRKYQSQSCANRLFFYCSDVNSTITFVMWATTWENAQAYCRENHMDLVTLEGGRHVEDLADDDLFYIWTGLHRARPGADWDWSIGRSDYENWEEGKPTEDGDCVGISNTNNMTNLDCNSSWPFYCFTDNLVLVKENKTWEEALEHCRTMDLADPSLQHFNSRNDLISISDQSVQHNVWSRIDEATTNEVWTGLRYLAHKWFWVDGTDVPYQDLPHCPGLGQYCGTLDRDNGTIPWYLRNCNEKRNFLCYRKY